MASRCLGRRTNERLLFGDGKHYFYTEERCKRKTEGGLCSVCDGSKNLEEHGIVSETIPPLSHIYGSAWYDLKRTVYGNPSSDDMAKAKKAQEEATATSKTDTEAKTEAKTEKKKRTFKIVTPVVNVTETSTAILTSTASPTPSAPKTKRQPKKIIQPQTTITPFAIESTEQPLQELPCITISVRRYEHNGRNYYLNSEKDKLYTVLSDGGVGKYCGRLDREKDCIADFPDSDSER